MQVVRYVAAAAFLAFTAFSLMLPQARAADVGADEAREIARDAYIYAYPLVLMEVSRRVLTNTDAPNPATTSAPINQFSHLRAFPDASFTDVVRPNADTLYSSMFFDVTKEPLVIDVPDSGGRYYLLPMLDMWTDIFASPGKRTTGTEAQKFAIVGPRWEGRLPQGVAEIRSPTGVGWMIGRTQTNGKADYDAVHKFQAGLTATPLSRYAKAYTAPKGAVNPQQSMSAPVEQVEKMDAATFFATFADATKSNPPHDNDYPILARMKRIGIEPGTLIDLRSMPQQIRTALEQAPREAMDQVKSAMDRSSRIANGWQMIMQPVGTYGTDYLKRAGIAYFGLGANVTDDAIYPSMLHDAQGKPLDSGAKYVLHFAKDQIPPVNAFWSVTMYNDRQFFTANPIDRYAIGDRDKLAYNPDGSLDLYVQRQSPGPDKEANWLPAPAQGPFSLTMRLYWPKEAALDGRWSPPQLQKIDESMATTGEGKK
jgi:hypothetical protein